MNRLLTLLFTGFLCAGGAAHSQVFWTENFETGAATGLQVSSYSSANGAWSLSVTGTEGADPNMWYVSCQEAGQLAGACGATCSGSPGLGASLHVGGNSSWTGDGGASYDAGGLCPIICPQTDRRATSPTINCTGKSNIRLKFYYILNGQGSSDDGSVYYSPDNGVTWSLLVTPPKTTLCPSTQGKWDTLGILLPSSANNNATVKIGFRWVNNDDGVGSDPSFAVDSVSLRTPGTAGPVSASMTSSGTTICEDSCLTFTNTSTGTVDSARWSSPGNTITTTSSSLATICFLNSGTQVVKLYLYNGGTRVDSASTTITVNPAPSPVVIKTGTTYSVPAVYSSYQWYTVAFPPVAISGATNATYTTTVTGTYAVKVDSAGCSNFAIYSAPGGVSEAGAQANFFRVSSGTVATLHSALPLSEPLNVSVYDVTGRRVYSTEWQAGTNTMSLSSMPDVRGLFLIRLSGANSSVVLRWQHE
ncbi:MAG: T9SS type A sorting domain-containing protein [Taibaiella sp.]|nr:T9SS type A sorting domain-containing protein [Taibaiella sp.]